MIHPSRNILTGRGTDQVRKLPIRNRLVMLARYRFRPLQVRLRWPMRPELLLYPRELFPSSPLHQETLVPNLGMKEKTKRGTNDKMMVTI